MGASSFLLGCLTLSSVVLASTISPRAKFSTARNRTETNKAWRSWDLVINRLSISYRHPDYFGPATQITLEGRQSYSYDFELLQSLPSDIKTVFRTFESNTGNKYIPSWSHTDTLCGEFTKVKQGMAMFKCFYYIKAGLRECPFEKGNYSIKHAKCTPNDNPPVVPGHYWIINNTWYTKDNVLIYNRLFDFTILQNHNIG